MLAAGMGFKPRRSPAAPRAGVSPAHASVDAYLASIPEPVREIASELRRIVRRAAPGIAERIKWNVPVFELGAPVCYLSAHAGYVRFGFYRGAEIEDPARVLGGTGSLLRHVKLPAGAPVPRQVLAALVEDAVRVARTG